MLRSPQNRKNVIFRQSKDNNSGWKHEKQTNDPIFYLYLPLCVYHSFLNLKTLKIHLHVVPDLVHSSLWNTFFGQKLAIWTTHHTFLKTRHSVFTENLYYVLSTCQSWISLFRICCSTLFRMGFFRAAHGLGREPFLPPPP